MKKAEQNCSEHEMYLKNLHDVKQWLDNTGERMKVCMNQPDSTECLDEQLEEVNVSKS